MQINYIIGFLYLKGVKVKEIIKKEKTIEIHVSTKASNLGD